MSQSTTGLISATALPTIAPFVTTELANMIQTAFHNVIFPCISVVGITGNVTSIILIARQGFRKYSNILLAALAVADVVFLLGLNNIPYYVMVHNDYQGFMFSEQVNNLLYVLYMMFTCAQVTGLYSSILIPVLITTERLLAIFMPLTVRTIVTPRRIVFVIACFIISSTVYYIYLHIACREFKQIIIEGVLLGKIFHSKWYVSEVESGSYYLFLNTFNYMTSVVPAVLVSTGSAIIGIQVSVITKKRKKLISGGVTGRSQLTSQAASRTTKTLLSVCILYSVCSNFGLASTYLPSFLAVENDITLPIILSTFRFLLFCVNSVGNFIIYVALNRNFKFNEIRSSCLRKERR